jgi:hypothetical protein
LPFLVDGAALMTAVLWLPPLAARLEQPSGLNALLLVVLYLLFCSGVYLSRKLLPQVENSRWLPPAWLLEPKVLAACGLGFALLMATTFAYQLGYFEAILQVSAGQMGEGTSAAFLVYAPGAWLGFSMLVILVQAFPVNANVPPGGRYTLFALLALLFSDGLLLFSGAQARAMLAGLGLTPGIGLWPAVLAAFLVSFFPARAIYQSRLPGLGSWLSFALLLLYCSLTAVFS